MIARFRIHRRSALVRFGVPLLVAAIAGCVSSAGASAQTGASQSDVLKREIERRFDVLPLQNGLALRPHASSSDVRSVELTGGTIAVDGTPVTGAELKAKLGDDADLVIQLSYLDAERQRTMFGVAAGRVDGRAPTPSLSEEPPPRSVLSRRRGGGDRVQFGGSVTIDPGEVVDGNAVAIGGSVHVFGEVRGEVTAIGGNVELGPTAVVSGNVVVVGGTLQRDPGARVSGNVQEVGWGSARAGNWWGQTWRGMTLSAGFALLSTLMRVTVLCLLAALVVLFGRDYVERISARAAAEPLKAGAIGLLAQILFLPLLIATIVLLVVTIIGIPLLVLIPFVVLALIFIALVGFTAVAFEVGRLLTSRLGWTTGPYLTTVLGVIAVASPLLLARFAGLVFPLTFGLGIVGALFEYLAWTVGFGAVALTRFTKAGDKSSWGQTPA